jgi:hypothetical protein
MRSILLVILVATLAFAGCESQVASIAREQNREAELSGSPFRWRVQTTVGGTAMMRVMIDLPLGKTKADAMVKKDILKQIEKVELSNHRAAPEVEEVRLLPDGREVWILKNKVGLAYIVSMPPSPRGDTDFSIYGPTLFQKKVEQRNNGKERRGHPGLI